MIVKVRNFKELNKYFSAGSAERRIPVEDTSSATGYDYEVDFFKFVKITNGYSEETIEVDNEISLHDYFLTVCDHLKNYRIEEVEEGLHDQLTINGRNNAFLTSTILNDNTVRIEINKFGIDIDTSQVSLYAIKDIFAFG